MRSRVLVAAVALVIAVAVRAGGQTSGPDTVDVRSGALTLRALLWRPNGRGPFPAILFNHGGYVSADSLALTQDAATLGPVFARHGYVLLFLFRRGLGLSAGQGTADGDLLARALASQGAEGRNRIQLQLMQGDELNDALAALSFVRARSDIDASRIGVVGHSFGGSLTVFEAARDTTVRAAVVFAGAAYSWAFSPELRSRLRAAVDRTRAPIFFIHAANDYSTASGKALAAEMQRLHRAHRLKIYPAVGHTQREGHNFIFSDVAMWELDVFAFLDSILRRRGAGR